MCTAHVSPYIHLDKKKERKKERVVEGGHLLDLHELQSVACR